ncbi:hypothetical protein QYE76_003818 [Lolium multiflorum]|uniref:Transposase (putative) gypsy type domain-containing protein n=1 Tax=Lolium multiflorum TaxID=4521 RepID=A0AAD8RPG5_LOLMU|nr:hypothetical protein QYE76_003818 [Lolium multiflorum]
MPPRTKLTKHTAPGTNAPTNKMEISGWERSKISNQDMKTLKKLGLLKKIQLHQLTPNSILHISIFITLCECFLGTHPHSGLWKRIFYLRRNNSRNTVYNVCICVRPDVDYFDVKFPDSVQGWRRRWLYIQDECENSQEYDIAPFDGAEEILRRRSWDAEATAEEKADTGALMKCIHQLQNTHGEELSESPSSIFSPPLPEVGEVDARTVVTDNLQESARHESEVAGSHKSAASSEKESDSDPSESGRSVSSLAVSSRNKRKRGEVEDSGTSKSTGSPAEEASPEDEGAFNPYDDAGSVSSSEEGEKEEPAILGTAPTGTSNTMIFSEENRTAAESSPPPQQNMETSIPPSSPRAPSPKRAKTGAGDVHAIVMGSSSTPLNDPLMEHFICLGSQSIGFRNEADALKGRMGEEFKLHEAEEDRLLDTLRFLELQGDLARTNISDVRAAFTRLFPHFFPKKT